jgi:hypothetical protein
MSTIKPLALYQIETFGAGNRHLPPRGSRVVSLNEPEPVRPAPARGARIAVPARASGFLVQLMVDGDSDLRKVLGRQDIAGRREAAYGAALARRPSVAAPAAGRVLGSA